MSIPHTLSETCSRVNKKLTPPLHSAGIDRSGNDVHNLCMKLDHALLVIQKAMDAHPTIKTHADLARALTDRAQSRDEPEVSQQIIHNWTKRGVPKTRYADIAAALDIPIETLHGLKPAQPRPTTADTETWTVPDYFNQAGAGGVALIDEDMRAGSLEVPAQRLRDKGLKVRDLGRLRALRVRGDSMEDYLYDGDTIVVLLRRDDGPEALMDGEKYVIRTPNDLKVKRLKSQIDGSLIVESINPRYPPETVTSSEELDIVGRVVFRQG